MVNNNLIKIIQQPENAMRKIRKYEETYNMTTDGFLRNQNLIPEEDATDWYFQWELISACENLKESKRGITWTLKNIST